MLPPPPLLSQILSWTLTFELEVLTHSMPINCYAAKKKLLQRSPTLRYLNALFPSTHGTVCTCSMLPLTVLVVIQLVVVPRWNTALFHIDFPVERRPSGFALKHHTREVTRSYPTPQIHTDRLESPKQSHIQRRRSSALDAASATIKKEKFLMMSLCRRDQTYRYK